MKSVRMLEHQTKEQDIAEDKTRNAIHPAQMTIFSVGAYAIHGPLKQRWLTG